MTAVPSGGTAAVELHAYEDGLAFVSNTDSDRWLRATVPPLSGGGSGGSGGWSVVLAPQSVLIVNRSLSPPQVIFDTHSAADAADGRRSATHRHQSSGSDDDSSSRRHSAPQAADASACGGVSCGAGAGWEYHLEVPGSGGRVVRSKSG